MLMFYFSKYIMGTRKRASICNYTQSPTHVSVRELIAADGRQMMRASCRLLQAYLRRPRLSRTLLIDLMKY